MKHYLLTIALCLMTIAASAQTFTFASSADVSQTQNGITLTIAKGDGSSNPNFTSNYLTSAPEMRLYGGNTVTLSGDTMTLIRLYWTKQGSKGYADLTASPDTLTSGGTSTDNNDTIVDVWRG